MARQKDALLVVLRRSCGGESQEVRTYQEPLPSSLMTLKEAAREDRNMQARGNWAAKGTQIPRSDRRTPW